MPPQTDLETGFSSETLPPLPTLQPRHKDLPTALTIFRTAIGINTTPDYTRSTTRSAHNRGIYARTCRAERSAHALYITTTLLLNTCLLLQVLIAACLTALGAANASHITITVLGVLNTAIAFVLTFMQGKGLPGNHQREWGALTGLRELIELRERELGVGGDAKGTDVKEVLREVVDAYHGVRRGAESEDIKAREANGTEGQLGAEQKDVKVVGS